MITSKMFFLMLLMFFTTSIQSSFSITNSQDAAALRGLMGGMKNFPPNWGQSSDPCGGSPSSGWDGVTCDNSTRVVQLKLYNMGLQGTLSDLIGSLTELQLLDLSYNKNLGGTLTPAIGKLTKLSTLYLIGCNFSGPIPNEIGNLAELTYLALNSNQFSGEIPASLGRLSNLFWLDLGENQLTGSLPVSTNTSPGLDQLHSAKHFHLNMNQLNGSIPETFFNSNLTVLHILLDRNKFTGTIPESVGLVQSLKVIRVDGNSLSSSVPASISNLTNLAVLNLAHNMLTGPMPNLTRMSALTSVDLSNNSFDPSEAPSWFSELGSLKSLVIESGSLHGKLPQSLFSIPTLQQVILSNNDFNGSLDMGSNVSQQLQIVNFKNNALTSIELSSSYNNTIILTGNPVCSNLLLSQTSYCIIQNVTPPPSFSNSTSHANCTSQSCPQDNSCPHPYQGLMVFRAPFFQDVTNHSSFETLEQLLWQKYNSSLGSLSLQNPSFDDNSYLQVKLKLCPSSGIYFNRTEILEYLDLSSRNFRPPEFFGPYYLNADPYHFQGGSSMSRGWIIGLAVGCSFLVLGLIAVGMYAFRQKTRAQKAIEMTNPFASWEATEDIGEAPQINGAKSFSFDELKKCTNNFPKVNEIGVGGYGKVYRGMLPDEQIVAIKRAQIGSTQGGLEFKTEIELLSRVHHINLVGLVGFCFQQGERMLVYEYIPNGTLRECLSGKNGIQLDWKRRLWIALGSAKGLAYLHEHANPPIIHRDIKSTNILLDDSLNAKVADFGLSKILSRCEGENVDTQIKGTLGYLDPEYYMTQILTEKSDVYSYGVVMLEMITARPPIHKGQYVVREVKIALDHNDRDYFGLKDIMDPAIRDAKSLIGFRSFVELALKCVEESSIDRPSMSEIVKEIEMILSKGGMTMNTSSVSRSSSARGFGISNVVKKEGYTDSSQSVEVSSDYFGSSLFSPTIPPSTR